jgi:hypothetical protein
MLAAIGEEVFRETDGSAVPLIGLADETPVGDALLKTLGSELG